VYVIGVACATTGMRADTDKNKRHLQNSRERRKSRTTEKSLRRRSGFFRMSTGLLC
jgi:hypothetical protein